MGNVKATGCVEKVVGMSRSIKRSGDTQERGFREQDRLSWGLKRLKPTKKIADKPNTH